VEVRIFCTTHWWLVLNSAEVLVTTAWLLKEVRTIRPITKGPLIINRLAPALFMDCFI
jgi:hypothetical protein